MNIVFSNENTSLTQDYSILCDALRDLVLFVQFKKCEKHLWRSVNFSKVAGFSIFLISKVFNSQKLFSVNNFPKLIFLHIIVYCKKIRPLKEFRPSNFQG